MSFAHSAEVVALERKIKSLTAERDALKDEVERLRQWYADSHRIIDEWDAKCSALKAEVERLNRLVPCRYCLEQYDPIEMHEMDYDDGPETKQFLICDDCYENHHSAEPPEKQS